MEDVLGQLKAGIRRFQTEVYPEQAETYRKAASEPQRPRALIVACADSRIDVESITQSGPGDIFVTRNIGNLVPAYGEMLGGVSAVIEYAVSALKVKHIVVCGHTDCGAMKALMHPEAIENMATVKSWMKNAHAALSVANSLAEKDERPSDMMKRLTRRYGVPAPRFSSVLLDACQRHAWPGNLRELENFAKRFLAHGDEDAALHDLHSRPDYGLASKGGNGNGIGHAKPGVLPSNMHTSEEKSSLKLLVRNAKGETERGAIAQALEETHWNRKAAARLLNISYRALLYKIQEYQMAPPAESARLLAVNGLRQVK